MANPKFSIGDFVYLKSGGPKMTVTNVRDVGHFVVHTQWFVGQKANSTNAHEDAFTTVDPNPKKDIAEKK